MGGGEAGVTVLTVWSGEEGQRLRRERGVSWAKASGLACFTEEGSELLGGEVTSRDHTALPSDEAAVRKVL